MTTHQHRPPTPPSAFAMGRRRIPRSPLLRWVLPLAGWIATLALTIVAAPLIARAIFVFFWIAVLFAAWYGGVFPALLIAFLSVMAVNFLFVPPVHSFDLLHPDDWVTFGIFVIASMSVSSLTAALGSAQRDAARYAEELELHARQLQDQAMELEHQTEESQMLAEEAEAANADLTATNLALQESEERWRALADAAPLLIWTSDARGARNWVNRGWVEFTGHDLEHSLGDAWLETAHPDDRDRYATVYHHAFARGEPFTIEYRLRRSDGAYRWMLATGAPRHGGDGQLTGYVASCMDITERRQVEEALTDANRAKSEFLATMSHELRTPLNAIGGYAELLEMGVRGAVNEAQKEDLRRIRRSQQHLMRLINDILNFSRLDAGHFAYDIDDVPANELLAGVGAMIEPQANARGIAYRYEGCDPRLCIRADAEKLRQVVLNLLSNAVKFTPEGGRITMSCTVHGDRARIAVADTGPGVPDDKREAIFEPFVQINRTLASGIEGTGLGLAIARDLARGMGGDLTLRSDAGGAEFSVTLPVSAGHPRDPELGAAPALA